ncbi:MAG TPA: hypothetical protein VKE94_14920 [Gemmataceae bacterium]|nr:hypothetical protein [Gemmataceae bacterium]
MGWLHGVSAARAPSPGPDELARTARQKPRLTVPHGFWTFDPDGGIGPAIWVYEGDRWGIDLTGTLANGSELTATNLLQRKGDYAFTCRSVQRTLDNEKLHDIGAVQVTRVGK